MQINLFEIIAQVFNFFLILFLLQKFLYKPVMGVMEKRQAMVEETIRESETKMQEADELIETYRERLEGIEEEERTMLDQARKESQETKDRLLANYRAQADEKRDAYFAEVEEQRESFETALRRTLGTSSVRLASNILANLTGDDLEDKAFDTFLQRIRGLSGHDEGVQASGAVLVLASARPLPEDRRRMVEETLQDTLGTHPDVRYEVDQDLVIGYELNFESYTLQANARKYLEETERTVMEQLRKKPN